MEKKQERNTKRYVIIVAMILLLLAMIAFCGFTFAKYITSTTVPTQQATVAKWGFVINANTDHMFGKEYKTGGTVAASGDTDIIASSTANIIAPGTNGYMTFGVTGTAEVLANLKIEFTASDVASLTNNDDAEDVYYPIKWTLKQKVSGTYTVVTGCENNDTLETIVEKLTTDTQIALGGTANYEYELSWKWDFNGNDRLDTLMGFAMADPGTYDNGTVEVISAGVVKDVTANKTYTISESVAVALKISVEQAQSPNA